MEHYDGNSHVQMLVRQQIELARAERSQEGAADENRVPLMALGAALGIGIVGFLRARRKA